MLVISDYHQKDDHDPIVALKSQTAVTKNAKELLESSQKPKGRLQSLM